MPKSISNNKSTKAQWVGAVAAIILTTVAMISGVIKLYAYPNSKGIALEIRVEERLKSVKVSLDRLREAITGVSQR